MIKVAIVLLEDSYCSSVTALMDTFQVANAHVANTPNGHGLKPIDWTFVSQKKGEAIQFSGGISLSSIEALTSDSDYDVVYLPAVYYHNSEKFEAWLKQYQWLQTTLVALRAKGSAIAAICTSTFLLAETGLLDGKKATTTWWLERHFKRRYPKVNLDAKLTLTQEDKLYCAGAMTSYNHLALQLIEEHLSASIANLTANAILVNRNLGAQTPFLDLNIPIASNDALVSKAQYWLRNHLSSDVDFPQLAEDFKVSQRTLIRRFKKATGVTPLNYLQSLRIDHAKTLLTQSALPIDEIMSLIGYTDPSAFYRLFKNRTGMTPSAYRQKFS